MNIINNIFMNNYDTIIQDTIHAIRLSAEEAGITDETIIQSMIDDYLIDNNIEIIPFVINEDNQSSESSEENESSDDDEENNQQQNNRRNMPEIHFDGQGGLYINLNMNGAMPNYNDIPNILNTLMEQINNLVPPNLDEKVIVSLSKQDVDKLKEFKYEELNNITKDERCSICFTELNEDSASHKYIQLDCKHTYHSDCIKKYLSEYDYHCPVCRAPCGKGVPKMENT